MRGRAMSRHADAEPTIGPTRPARSRTTSVLSPAAAPAVPASNALNKKRIKRVVIANLREAKIQSSTVSIVLLCRSVVSISPYDISIKTYLSSGDYPFGQGAYIIEALPLGS